VQAATVAHEMGTPLSTIAMLTEELRDAARADPGLARYEADLKVLEEQMTLCTSALARLRSRASAPASRQPVDDWLDTFVEHWRLRHPHVQFELLGARPSGVALDDTVAAGQILTILLDNAARASLQRVTLAAKLTHHDRVADQIEFEVCDDGPGIPAALRESLGSMPVDSTQGGHGVGLYLAFSAAARLGGDIELSDVTPRAAGNGRAGGAHPQAAAAAASASTSVLERMAAAGRGTRAVLRRSRASRRRPPQTNT
jgi:two-component system sensor histidine kinase RegB